MISVMRNKTCSMKNLIHCMIKFNHPMRFKSTLATLYPDHELIYKFPLIRGASIINKLKLYQTVATVAGIPAIAVLAASDIVTPETTLVFSISGVVWCLSFYAIGFLGQNLVGYIYLKNDLSSIKISYADFWGRRVDTDIEIDDIWPLNDLPTSIINPLYYSLRRYSTKETLKFNMKYGDIVNAEKFQLVFGNLFLTMKR